MEFGRNIELHQNDTKFSRNSFLDEILSAIRQYCPLSVPARVALQKIFVPILTEYTINEYTLRKDLFTFAEEIPALNPNDYMVSYDVDYRYFIS